MERDRWVACISVSRRPLAATCMKGHIGPACSVGCVDPVSLSCRKVHVTYPTAQGRASLARLLRLLLPIQSTRLFRLGVRLWAIRRSEQRLLASVSCRGRRRQGTRVQGSWVHRRRSLVAIVLNTRQGTCLRVVLPDLLVLAPVLLVPDPTLLLVVRP